MRCIAMFNDTWEHATEFKLVCVCVCSRSLPEFVLQTGLVELSFLAQRGGVIWLGTQP